MSLPVKPPFELVHQLNSDLDKVPVSSSSSSSLFSLPSASPTLCLPGYSQILLQNRRKVLQFLEEEFHSQDLDWISDRLWWMSKQDSRTISPLHRQAVKQRVIIVMEDPKLHLVWIYNRIFIKPLPRYILSYTFWRDYIGNQEAVLVDRIRRAALGYLRTYRYLVRYESDFRIAQDPGLRLIPADVTWEQFCSFTADLANITDRDVSSRYAYGEIRLTRLNFYAPLLLRKSYFQRVEYQYATYFTRFYGPILFIIGVVSIVLSGLQVVVSVDQGPPRAESQSLSAVALWFSVAMIICFGSLIMCFCILLIHRIAKEWKYVIQDRLRILEEGREMPTEQ